MQSHKQRERKKHHIRHNLTDVDAVSEQRPQGQRHNDVGQVEGHKVDHEQWQRGDRRQE